jgi:hypothetical protein
VAAPLPFEAFGHWWIKGDATTVLLVAAMVSPRLAAPACSIVDPRQGLNGD